MTTATPASRIIAQMDPLQPIVDRFRFAEIPVQMLLIILGSGLALAFAAWVFLAWKRARRVTEESRLFRDVITDCKLNPSNRRCLEQVAAAEGLRSPLTLLLCPATFEHHFDHQESRVTGPQLKWLRKNRAAIQALIFTDPESSSTN